MTSDAAAACWGCGEAVDHGARGRPRWYCCNACRQGAYRRRLGAVPRDALTIWHHSAGCRARRSRVASPSWLLSGFSSPAPSVSTPSSPTRGCPLSPQRVPMPNPLEHALVRTASRLTRDCTCEWGCFSESSGAHPAASWSCQVATGRRPDSGHSGSSRGSRRPPRLAELGEARRRGAVDGNVRDCTPFRRPRHRRGP